MRSGGESRSQTTTNPSKTERGGRRGALSRDLQEDREAAELARGGVVDPTGRTADGEAMAAYAALPTEDSMEYRKVKTAILRRYQVNEETHRLRFRQDRRKGDESHREWADRLRDHFEKWTKGATYLSRRSY